MMSAQMWLRAARLRMVCGLAFGLVAIGSIAQISSATPPPQDFGQANSKIALTQIPGDVINRIKADIKQRDRISLSQIKLVGAQARTWNGCFGLEKPGTACIEIAISGWQVVLTGPNQRYWVYHVDQSGGSIARNYAASSLKTNQIPAPRFVDQIVQPSSDTTIFQSAVRLGETPAYVAIELKTAGDDFILTQRRIAPQQTRPKVIKRLTAKQVQPFLATLDRQNFNHFNQLSYFNSAAIAVDAPLLQLSSYGTTVEYTGGDEAQLPPKLRLIVRAWKTLSE
jgi:hypothetical protein